MLLGGGKVAAAEILVRAGARYRSVAGVDPEMKARFDGLAAEYNAEQKHRAETAKSMAAMGGAASLAARESCIKAG